MSDSTYELTRTAFPHFARYTSFASPIDATYGGKPCRAIRVETAGTLTVKRASDGASAVLAAKDGETLNVACLEVSSVSGPSAIVIYW